MKKVILAAALIVAGLYGAQAQTTPRTTTNPPTDGTTRNSGVGNGTNGSASPRGTTNQRGAVGAENGTSYGMQSTKVSSGTAMKGMKKKDMKMMKKKDSNM